jgi:hypothetical protein
MASQEDQDKNEKGFIYKLKIWLNRYSWPFKDSFGNRHELLGDKLYAAWGDVKRTFKKNEGKMVRYARVSDGGAVRGVDGVNMDIQDVFKKLDAIFDMTVIDSQNNHVKVFDNFDKNIRKMDVVLKTKILKDIGSYEVLTEQLPMYKPALQKFIVENVVAENETNSDASANVSKAKGYIDKINNFVSKFNELKDENKKSKVEERKVESKKVQSVQKPKPLPLTPPQAVAAAAALTELKDLATTIIKTYSVDKSSDALLSHLASFDAKKREYDNKNYFRQELSTREMETFSKLLEEVDEIKLKVAPPPPSPPFSPPAPDVEAKSLQEKY